MPHGVGDHVSSACTVVAAFEIYAIRWVDAVGRGRGRGRGRGGGRGRVGGGRGCGGGGRGVGGGVSETLINIVFAQAASVTYCIGMEILRDQTWN